MLSVLHHPELATPALLAWLRPHVRYGDDGRSSKFLVEDAPLPPELADVARAVCPGRAFRAVALQCYRDGRATTPCHSDRGAAGFSFVFSVCGARTFRVHPVRPGESPTAACDGGPEGGAVRVRCVAGTAVLMDQCFHDSWHHQVAADPGVTGERLALVFRARPE